MYIGKIWLNNDRPWIPTKLKKASLSEHERIADLLWTGKSNLPGLVLKMPGWYFDWGYWLSLRYFRGFAPEKDYYF